MLFVIAFVLAGIGYMVVVIRMGVAQRHYLRLYRTMRGIRLGVLPEDPGPTDDLLNLAVYRRVWQALREPQPEADLEQARRIAVHRIKLACALFAGLLAVVILLSVAAGIVWLVRGAE